MAVLLTLYCDESYYPPSRPKIYAVAGFLANQLIWLDTVSKWESCLRDHDNLPYFRASECETLVGAFARFRDNPKDVTVPLSQVEKQRRNEVKKAFVDIVVNSSVVGFGAALIVDDLKAIRKSHPKHAKEFRDPYSLCAQFAISAAGYATTRINHEKRSDAILSFVFEENREVSGRFGKVYQEFQEKNPYISEYMGSYTFARYTKYVPLQAGDLLAYETMKLLRNSVEFPTLKTRIAVKRMKEGIQCLYRLDQRTLTAVVEKISTGKSLETIVRNRVAPSKQEDRRGLREFFVLGMDD